jgi:hypothetical protein
MQAVQQNPSERAGQARATRRPRAAVPSASAAMRTATSVRRPRQQGSPREVAATEHYGCVEWFDYTR